MRIWLLAALVLSPVSALAQIVAAQCEGFGPDWSIELSDQNAEFTYGRSFTFNIPQRNDAENRTWPKALTLVEEQQRYTAILIIDQASCKTKRGKYAYSAYVLTQRASTPILLAGCCDI